VKLDGRSVAWTAAAVWLCANVALFAVHGVQRVIADARLSQSSSVAEKRAKVWGPSLERAVLAFENTLNEAAPRHFDRVLLVAPAPRNVFESLAWHVLFPAAIEIASPGGSLDAWRREALERGADAMIYPHSGTSWRVVDLRTVAGDSR
jgi:hypothetical protein